MKKKKLNIDQSYSNSDTNKEFNTDLENSESSDLINIESDEVYDDLDFMDQYEDTGGNDEEFNEQSI
jgi:hypothetical protein